MAERAHEGKSYDKLLLLDRLETLREDMEELEIRTREELDSRIEELHRQVDEAEQD